MELNSTAQTMRSEGAASTSSLNRTFPASSDETTSSTTTQLADFLDVFVLATGIVGVLANGLVTLVLAMSKQLSKERVNILVLNQTILDFVSSFMLMVIYSLRRVKLTLVGVGGYFLCMFVLDEMLLWVALTGSTANLVVIAVERYLMIVHPIWHKNHVNKFMIYGFVTFVWIDGILLNVPLTYVTTKYDYNYGTCTLFYWSNEQSSQIYGVWYFIYAYVLSLAAFVYCYGRILVVVRKRVTSLAPAAAPASSSSSTVSAATGKVALTPAQLNAHRAQMNVIKTMMIITASFIVCWLPNSIYYFLTCITTLDNFTIYFASLALAFFNVCLNPFIYGGQYGLIRERLKATIRTMCCVSRGNQSDVIGAVMMNAQPTGTNSTSMDVRGDSFVRHKSCKRNDMSNIMTE